MKARFDWFLFRLIKGDVVTLIEVDATQRPLTMRQAEAVQRRKYKGDWYADLDRANAYNWRLCGEDDRKLVLQWAARGLME